MDDQQLLQDVGFGGPSRPLHIVIDSWYEQTKKLEDDIIENSAFEGEWQSYLQDGFKIIIPDEMRKLFKFGGVVTAGVDHNLNLYGNKHWSRLQRVLSKENAMSPVNTSFMRHIYANMIRFDKLNDDGSIVLPLELIKYARLTDEIAIVGMVYYAEIHNKRDYIEDKKLESFLLHKEKEYDNDNKRTY